MSITPTAPVAATAEPNVDGTWTCQVEGCGRIFSRKQGLGRHMHETHGAKTSRQLGKPKTARAGTGKTTQGILAGIEREMKELVAPMQSRLDQINHDIESKRAELAELSKARVYVEGMLRKLTGESAKASRPMTDSHREASTAAARARGAELKQQKRVAVRAFIDTHADELSEGFTGSSLYDRMRAVDVQPVASPEVVREFIEELRDAGVIRADRLVRGGGMAYVLVNNNHGGSSDGSS
jgi:uncharacterized C2H2 Zn-finger protein